MQIIMIVLCETCSQQNRKKLQEIDQKARYRKKYEVYCLYYDSISAENFKKECHEVIVLVFVESAKKDTTLIHHFTSNLSNHIQYPCSLLMIFYF
mmetsp:Transcript_12364/g.24654  ORF Transcript_12364/g.24654 Transcript_12364/m.24654 type:complete len:95 (+) Transcript_12364:1251-1535(+)